MEKNTLNCLGDRIKELRNKKRLSQEELSFLTNIDRSYISDVERGTRNISLQNIAILAEAFHLPIYQLFLASDNILERWEIDVAQLENLILDNPSLRGFIIGYLAEAKLRDFFQRDERITHLKKFDDHDRNNKHDLVVYYKNQPFTIEIKSLQTATVKASKSPDTNLEAKFQCDASDKRKIKLLDGSEIETTCLRFNDFDIIAVNLFAFNGKWEFAFALNKDLPCSQYKKYPEEIRDKLIKSIVPITYPVQYPFVTDPFLLLDFLAQERGY